MSDLIDRQAALDAFYHIRCNLQMMDDTQTADKIMHGLWLAENAIKLVTSVPIVRCKDCKYRDTDGYCQVLGDMFIHWESLDPVPDDFFCARGTRS